VAARLGHPLVEDPRFAPNRLNVAAQRRDPDSLLNWLERALRRRLECPEFGLGLCTFIDTGHPAVLAHRCDLDGRTVFAVHNFSARRVNVELPLEDDAAAVQDILNHDRHEVQEKGRVRLQLEPYGCRWLRQGPQGAPP
jgi:maltose alpha-D-glucosyltransferase/alpha-amylase